MRIISGKLRGRVILPPKNLRARPTTDFAKENLFNILQNNWEIEGLDVLDLFAGTGSISYEFASRGAETVAAVEINAVHQNFIKDTARKFGLDNLFATKANVFLYLKSVSKKFDLIFSDPPYDINGIESIPDLIFENDVLKKGGWLIVEHGKETNFTGHPRFLQQRTYGSVNFSFFTKD